MVLGQQDIHTQKNDGIFPLKNLWPYKNVYMNVHQSIIPNRQKMEFPNVHQVSNG